MPSNPSSPAEPNLLSIGRLASAVGITPDTLRIWERRYGSPVPVRLPSGHRRYPRQEVHRLRLVSELLSRGKRPGSIVRLSTEELEAMLGASPDQDLAHPELVVWLSAARSMHREELATSMMAVAQRTSPIEFLEDYVVPYMRRIGSEWAAGQLDVRHEHFATEILIEILHGLRQRSVARQLPREGEPKILLASLPGEQHELGLLMVSYLLDLHACNVHNLGAEAPVEEIADAACEIGAQYLGLSISVANAGPATDRALGRLREQLPNEIGMIVGGAGSRNVRRRVPGALSFPDLRTFWDWAGKEFGASSTPPARPRFFGGLG